jgi:membrane protein
MLLFGASGVFVQLQDALNSIWNVAPKPGRTLHNIIEDRVLSLVVVLGTGFLLLVSLVLSAALSALNGVLRAYSFPGDLELWQWINGGFSFVLITLLFAAIFKLLPDVKIGWRYVWGGAALTSLLFSVGKFGLGLYLAHSGVASAFGAAASLVIILIWVYFSAQILLFGAEFTKVYARYRGARLEPADNAEWIACSSG